MAPVSLLNAYERTPLKATGASRLFLYALHQDENNSLHIGFGMESVNELQRAHILGPQVHEYHVSAFVDWLASRDPVDGLLLREQVEGKRHPLSSAGQTVAEYRALLDRTPCLELSAGRFMPLVATIKAIGRLAPFAQAVDRCRIDAFGHPLDWDTQHLDLPDGRFCWMAYDSEIEKIRLGMGYHDGDNEKLYGLHSYAVGLHQVAGFAASEFAAAERTLPFMGLPPRWPETMSPFVNGKDKKLVIGALLRLADRVWPGQVE
ncbi:hypothetical protein MARCHEWKA_05420 [Brevundimonas phage vB_BpoS-Marchewka]|uniref:Uncharacterized protein n=1 Tax=Brevundimonas phage vB_BpoS-Marchewka TaxID=2948604 RepID=A0A9E7N378_9CAUD|nr:hypothetical protein MARCHEWKA_05420 [Brevundimonas phage vB_BpoS-Marchewka]UTC29491.1 hypothetical protein BAMBUS_04120 [Brevundimonas phage vB_BpoS-Bambus]